jgi:3-isopropylmalate/(R)-2-methylmalate dehydratase large subunit
MLEILAREDVRRGDFIGKAVVFSGSSLKHIGIDERATMTNMAVEAGAFTGICEPDDVALKYLKRLRKISDSELRRLMVRSDKNAGFSREITMDLSGTVPMAALPSDPRTGIPVSEISGNIFIDIAYGGSCTGSKMQDMDQYASIVKKALNMGLKCHESVKFFIQFGSLLVKDYCRKKGYLRLFRDFGARLIDPGCGACINAGPGISEDSDQVTISAINRNYPGRSGPGRMYLGSPLTVASSAVRGRITSPEEFFPG